MRAAKRVREHVEKAVEETVSGTVYVLRGLPPARVVICNLKRSTIRCIHFIVPNGVPLFTELRSAASCCAWSDSFTHA